MSKSLKKSCAARAKQTPTNIAISVRPLIEKSEDPAKMTYYTIPDFLSGIRPVKTPKNLPMWRRGGLTLLEGFPAERDFALESPCGSVWARAGLLGGAPRLPRPPTVATWSAAGRAHQS